MNVPMVGIAQSPVTGLVYWSLWPQQACGSRPRLIVRSASRVRLARALIGVPEQGRGPISGFVLDRLHGVPELRQVIALGQVCLLGFLRALLHELRIE